MGEVQQLFFCCYMVAKAPVVFKSMHQRVERSSEESYGRVNSVWLCPIVIGLLQTDQYPCGGTLNQRFCESIPTLCFEDFRGDRPMSGWFSRIIRQNEPVTQRPRCFSRFTEAWWSFREDGHFVKVSGTFNSFSHFTEVSHRIWSFEQGNSVSALPCNMYSAQWRNRMVPRLAAV